MITTTEAANIQILPKGWKLRIYSIPFCTDLGKEQHGQWVAVSLTLKASVSGAHSIASASPPCSRILSGVTCYQIAVSCSLYEWEQSQEWPILPPWWCHSNNTFQCNSIFAVIVLISPWEKCMLHILWTYKICKF